MSYHIRFIIYLIVIAMAITTSILRFKRLDKAERVFTLLLILTLVSEITAFYFAIRYRNNSPVYHVFAPVQLFMVGLYFHHAIRNFKKKKIGIYIGVIGAALSVLNSLYLQPLTALNSYFLMFEGLCTTYLCLYAFNQMFIDDDINLLTSPHFWFTFILLTFWNITYITWGLYEFMPAKMTEASSVIGFILWVVNIITYLGIGLVFYFTTKKIVQRE